MLISKLIHKYSNKSLSLLKRSSSWDNATDARTPIIQPRPPLHQSFFYQDPYNGTFNISKPFSILYDCNLHQFFIEFRTLLFHFLSICRGCEAWNIFGRINGVKGEVAKGQVQEVSSSAGWDRRILTQWLSKHITPDVTSQRLHCSTLSSPRPKLHCLAQRTIFSYFSSLNWKIRRNQIIKLILMTPEGCRSLTRSRARLSSRCLINILHHYVNNLFNTQSSISGEDGSNEIRSRANLPPKPTQKIIKDGDGWLKNYSNAR